MIGFERFPSPARKLVFQGIAEKMTLFRMKDADFRQKVSKSVKKSSKKVLTGERDCDIIIELSARAIRRADGDDP